MRLAAKPRRHRESFLEAVSRCSEARSALAQPRAKLSRKKGVEEFPSSPATKDRDQGFYAPISIGGSLPEDRSSKSASSARSSNMVQKGEREARQAKKEMVEANLRPLSRSPRQYTKPRPSNSRSPFRSNGQYRG